MSAGISPHLTPQLRRDIEWVASDQNLYSPAGFVCAHSAYQISERSDVRSDGRGGRKHISSAFDKRLQHGGGRRVRPYVECVPALHLEEVRDHTDSYLVQVAGDAGGDERAPVSFTREDVGIEL